MDNKASSCEVSTKSNEASILDYDPLLRSVAKEGLTTLLTRLFLPSGDDSEYSCHKSYTSYFSIVFGLCDLIKEEAVSCTSTTSSVEKLIKVRDLLSRLELQLRWIGYEQKIVMIEIPKMTEAFYKEDFEGILSSIENVKTETLRQSNKVVEFFLMFTKPSLKPVCDGWKNYLIKLKEDWKKKHFLLNLKNNRALQLQDKAVAIRQSLQNEGLASPKLAEDLKKIEDCGHYYSIVPGLMIDHSYSPLQDSYERLFDLRTYLFRVIRDKCLPEEPADEDSLLLKKLIGILKDCLSLQVELSYMSIVLKHREMPELLKMLEEYTARVGGGSVIVEAVMKVTRSFDIGDLDGLESGLVEVENGLDKLAGELKKYFRLMDQIRSYETLDCFVELKVPGSDSSSKSKNTDSHEEESLGSYSTRFSLD